MNKAKVSIKINCDTCGCSMSRVKTIMVSASNVQDGKVEAAKIVSLWKESLKGTDCSICKSIKKDLAA